MALKKQIKVGSLNGFPLRVHCMHLENPTDVRHALLDHLRKHIRHGRAHPIDFAKPDGVNFLVLEPLHQVDGLLPENAGTPPSPDSNAPEEKIK